MRHPSPAHAVLLATGLVLALVVTGCPGGKEAVVIGDAASVPGEVKSMRQFTMGMHAFMDGKFKLQATLGDKRSERDGYINLQIMGGGGTPIEVLVSPKYQAQVDVAKAGDDVILVGSLASVGPEGSEVMAIKVE